MYQNVSTLLLVEWFFFFFIMYEIDCLGKITNISLPTKEYIYMYIYITYVWFEEEQ